MHACIVDCWPTCPREYRYERACSHRRVVVKVVASSTPCFTGMTSRKQCILGWMVKIGSMDAVVRGEPGINHTPLHRILPRVHRVVVAKKKQNDGPTWI